MSGILSLFFLCFERIPAYDSEFTPGCCRMGHHEEGSCAERLLAIFRRFLAMYPSDGLLVQELLLQCRLLVSAPTCPELRRAMRISQALRGSLG